MATMKTQTSPIKGRTMRIELVCVCGKRLFVWLGKGESWKGLKAVAAPSLWKVCEDYAQKLGGTVDAYCPSCWNPVPLHHADA